MKGRAREDIVWGHLVGSLEASPPGRKHEGKTSNIEPGDIAQIKDAKFHANKNHKRYTVLAKHTPPWSRRRAITAGNSKVLEQNRNGDKFVTEGHVLLRDLKEGYVHIYRPEAKGKE